MFGGSVIVLKKQPLWKRLALSEFLPRQQSVAFDEKGFFRQSCQRCVGIGVGIEFPDLPVRKDFPESSDLFFAMAVFAFVSAGMHIDFGSHAGSDIHLFAEGADQEFRRSGNDKVVLLLMVLIPLLDMTEM